MFLPFFGRIAGAVITSVRLWAQQSQMPIGLQHGAVMAQAVCAGEDLDAKAGIGVAGLRLPMRRIDRDGQRAIKEALLALNFCARRAAVERQPAAAYRGRSLEDIPFCRVELIAVEIVAEASACLRAG
jgi:hypothetical protein